MAALDLTVRHAGQIEASDRHPDIRLSGALTVARLP